MLSSTDERPDSGYIPQRQFLAFDAARKSGVEVALGDLDGDGELEVAYGTSDRTSSEVVVSSLSGLVKWRQPLPPGDNFFELGLCTGQFAGDRTEDLAVSVAPEDMEGRYSLRILDGRSGATVETLTGNAPGAKLAAGLLKGEILQVQASLQVTQATLQSLRVVNSNSLLLNAAQPQLQLRVRAVFTDGSEFDVTDLVEYGVDSIQGAVVVEVEAVASRFEELRILPDFEFYDPQFTPTQQFEAFGILPGGDSEDITTKVTWSTQPSNLVTVDESGLATFLGYGSATIEVGLPGTELRQSRTVNLVVSD